MEISANIYFHQDIEGTVYALNQDDTGVTSWRWLMLDRPAGSTVSLRDHTTSQCSFVPDTAGNYVIRLEVEADGNNEICTASHFKPKSSNVTTKATPMGYFYDCNYCHGRVEKGKYCPCLGNHYEPLPAKPLNESTARAIELPKKLSDSGREFVSTTEFNALQETARRLQSEATKWKLAAEQGVVNYLTARKAGINGDRFANTAAGDPFVESLVEKCAQVAEESRAPHAANEIRRLIGRAKDEEKSWPDEVL